MISAYTYICSYEQLTVWAMSPCLVFIYRTISLTHFSREYSKEWICWQIQGLWKVKNQNISNLYEEAKKLKDRFVSFQIIHILRVRLQLRHRQIL